jgi:hypothetical protein
VDYQQRRERSDLHREVRKSLKEPPQVLVPAFLVLMANAAERGAVLERIVYRRSFEVAVLRATEERQ